MLTVYLMYNRCVDVYLQVLTLTDVHQGDVLYHALERNLNSAIKCGVLLQDSEKFNKEQLYTKITELSYNGTNLKLLCTA